MDKVMYGISEKKQKEIDELEELKGKMPTGSIAFEED